MTRDDFRSLLGEGLHTAFRKATDCEEADDIWAAINNMDSSDWNAVLSFVVEGFEYGGMVFDKEVATA